MKRFLLLISLAALLFPACESEEPVVRRRPGHYPRNPPQQYPPAPDPFLSPTPSPADAVDDAMATSSPAPTAAAAPSVKGDIPYGIPVPGKPGLVTSPFTPDKYVDVSGFPPGTEVTDPYSGKVFLVP